MSGSQLATSKSSPAAAELERLPTQQSSKSPSPRLPAVTQQPTPASQQSAGMHQQLPPAAAQVRSQSPQGLAVQLSQQSQWAMQHRVLMQALQARSPPHIQPRLPQSVPPQPTLPPPTLPPTTSQRAPQQPSVPPGRPRLPWSTAPSHRPHQQPTAHAARPQQQAPAAPGPTVALGVPSHPIPASYPAALQMSQTSTQALQQHHAMMAAARVSGLMQAQARPIQASVSESADDLLQKLLLQQQHRDSLLAAQSTNGSLPAATASGAGMAAASSVGHPCLPLFDSQSVLSAMRNLQVKQLSHADCIAVAHCARAHAGLCA